MKSICYQKQVPAIMISSNLRSPLKTELCPGHIRRNWTCVIVGNSPFPIKRGVGWVGGG